MSEIQTPIVPESSNPPAVIEPARKRPAAPAAAGKVPAAGAPPRRERKPFRAGARVKPIIPTDLDQLARMADWIIASGMVPDSYVVDSTKQKPPITQEKAYQMTKSRVMMGLQAGAEVGLAPLQAIRTIAVINNRPCIWGDGAVGLIQARGVIQSWEEHFESKEKITAPVSNEYGELDYSPTTADFPDDYTCVVTIWRKGQTKPYIGRFSVRDARRGKLWNNPKKVPWIEYPKRMLTWRARTFAMRDGFADCLMGLAIAEEVRDMTIEADEIPIVSKDDGEFADQMAAAIMGARQTAALPAPNEQPMEIIIPEGKTAVTVDQNQIATEAADPITVSRVTPAPAPESPDVPLVEIHKPLGARLPNWKLTREMLCNAFMNLETTALCAAFRAKNTATINQLRDNAKFEWEIWQEISGSHEYTIYEREQSASSRSTSVDVG